MKLKHTLTDSSHTCMHAHTHARTHARMHTHMEICYIYNTKQL